MLPCKKRRRQRRFSTPSRVSSSVKGIPARFGCVPRRRFNRLVRGIARSTNPAERRDGLSHARIPEARPLLRWIYDGGLAISAPRLPRMILFILREFTPVKFNHACGAVERSQCP
jgi:hypothetical protein